MGRRVSSYLTPSVRPISIVPEDVAQRPASIDYQGEPTNDLEAALHEDTLVQQDDGCFEHGDSEWIEDAPQKPPPKAEGWKG